MQRIRQFRLEGMLGVAVVALIGQLLWPSLLRWSELPRPGSIGIDEFDQSVIDDPESLSLASRFVVYLPNEYGAKKHSWPLVVFLHGSGERGSDPAILSHIGPLDQIAKGKNFPAIVAVPQCLNGGQWEPSAVVAFVGEIKHRYHIDPQRLYIIGYSMGGSGVWDTIATYPELFAAAVPIAGQGDQGKTGAMIHVPIWAFHGENDQAIPVDASEQMVSVIRKAGGTAKLTILAGEGHGICESVCSRTELWQWLFLQIRNGNIPLD